MARLIGKEIFAEHFGADVAFADVSAKPGRETLCVAARGQQPIEINLGKRRDHTGPTVGADRQPVDFCKTARSVRIETLARLVRGTTSQGIDVHLLGSMNGIDARRVRPVPFGHEASLHVSGVSLDGWQAVVKRVFDLTTSVVILILAAPLFLCVAAAIKCNDRGPVFFSQERIGRNGRPFRMWKFRSMVVDAEARLAEVEASNARSGPLFKAARDPRITKVGQVLRATSIDELPQVFNVIRGDMSLVGPRPALAREVEQFSPALQRRSAVLPGVTGIWQIEGRDEPDFSLYEEADIFYVENWSVTLDVAILVRTFFSILARAARYRPRRKDGTRLVLE